MFETGQPHDAKLSCGWFCLETKYPLFQKTLDIFHFYATIRDKFLRENAGKRIMDHDRGAAVNSTLQPLADTREGKGTAAEAFAPCLRERTAGPSENIRRTVTKVESCHAVAGEVCVQS